MTREENIRFGDALSLACNTIGKAGDTPGMWVAHMRALCHYARAAEQFIGPAGLIGETFPGEWRAGPKSESWREI